MAGRELHKVWKDSRGLEVSYRALRLDTFLDQFEQEVSSWQVHWGTCDPYTSWERQEISSRWFQDYTEARNFYLSIKKPRGISRYCDA